MGEDLSQASGELSAQLAAGASGTYRNGSASSAAKRTSLAAARQGAVMKWSKPVIREYCVGMEVTSYESADIDPLF